MSVFEKLKVFMQQKLMPALTKFSQHKYVKAIMSGFMTSMAGMMMGGIALLIISPPFTSEQFTTGILHTIAVGWEAVSAALFYPMLSIYQIALGSCGLLIAAGIAFYLARELKMEGFIPISIPLTCYLILAAIGADGMLSFTNLGSAGIFTALISIIPFMELYKYLVDHKVGTINLNVPGVPPAIAQSFLGMVPGTICVLIAASLQWLCVTLTGGSTVPELVTYLISPLVHGIDSLPSVILITVCIYLLWWFGIHDAVITGPLGTVWSIMGLANTQAYYAGVPAEQLPYVFTSSMFWAYAATWVFPCVLCMLMFCRSKRYRTLAKVGLVPSIFCIGEPIVFGMPTMLNVTMFVPIVLVPTLNITIAYLCAMFGLVGRGWLGTTWCAPMIMQAFMIAFDWRALILAVALIVIDIIIFLPFIRSLDRKAVALENGTVKEEQLEQAN